MKDKQLFLLLGGVVLAALFLKKKAPVAAAVNLGIVPPDALVSPRDSGYTIAVPKNFGNYGGLE